MGPALQRLHRQMIAIPMMVITGTRQPPCSRCCCYLLNEMAEFKKARHWPSRRETVDSLQCHCPKGQWAGFRMHR